MVITLDRFRPRCIDWFDWFSISLFWIGFCFLLLQADLAKHDVERKCANKLEFWAKDSRRCRITRGRSARPRRPHSPTFAWMKIFPLLRDDEKCQEKSEKMHARKEKFSGVRKRAQGAVAVNNSGRRGSRHKRSYAKFSPALAAGWLDAWPAAKLGGAHHHNVLRPDVPCVSLLQALSSHSPSSTMKATALTALTLATFCAPSTWTPPTPPLRSLEAPRRRVSARPNFDFFSQTNLASRVCFQTRRRSSSTSSCPSSPNAKRTRTRDASRTSTSAWNCTTRKRTARCSWLSLHTPLCPLVIILLFVYTLKRTSEVNNLV